MSALPPGKIQMTGLNEVLALIGSPINQDYDYEVDCANGIIKLLKPEVQLPPIELDERTQAFIDKDWAGDLPSMLDELIDIVKESEV